MKKLVSLITTLAIALLLFAGPALAEGVTFTMALDGDIVALDPAYAYDFTTNPVVNQIAEPLLYFNDEGQIEPFLVESWEVADDTTYVYNVRSDVNFSDGSPMTMEDVLYSINRHMDPDVGSYLGWMFSGVSSIEQTGDWQFTVHLKQPSATWQYVLGTSAGQIISKAYYEADEGADDGGLMGTGAYVFDSWRSGQEIVLLKNENYWNKDEDIAVDKIVFKIIPEDITRITALRTDQVDFAVIVPDDMLDMLADNTNITVNPVETAGIVYLAFNTELYPFDDVKVRQAIYQAIDFESIHTNIIKSAGEIGTVIPHSASLYTINPEEWEEYAANAPTYPYDVDAAKALLAESSAPDGFSCTLITNENSLRYSMCLAIQEYLKAINIDVEIVKASSDEHTTIQMGGVLDENGLRDYGMLVGGWESDFPDMSGNIEPLYLSSNAGADGANAAVYINPELDELIEAQAASTDPNERNQLMFQALDIITEQIPYIFTMYPIRNMPTSNEFTGYTLNSSWLWSMMFKNLELAA